MPVSDYYTSERFIQDALAKRVETALTTLYDTWRRQKHIPPFAIFWPATPVKDTNGIQLEGPCLRELDADPGLRQRQMAEAIGLTNAYALVLVIQRADHVRVILESQHGPTNWVLPIQDCSDGSKTLGHAKKVESGAEHVGLLWKPTSRLS